MGVKSVQWPRWVAYGAAILGAMVATLLRLALEPVLGPSAVPFITYFPIIVLVTWFGGLGPGALNVVLGALAANYYFLPPLGEWISSGSEEWVALGLYVLVGLGLAWLGDSQKRAEAAVRRERLRFETTLSSIGDAVIATDAMGVVVFANHVARGLLRSPRDPVGQELTRLFRIVNEETRAAVESPVTRVLREGAVVGLANHTVLLAGDDTEIPIDDSAAPILDGQGRMVGTVLVFRDVSERRAAERARWLLAAIVESTDDAVVSKDLDGRITSWNAGAERMFGYTEQEVLGRPVSILAVPGRNEMPNILERIRKGERLDHYETVRRNKRGETLHVSLSVSPLLDDQGQVIGASKIVRNMTARLRAMEALRETNEALKRSNQDLERFAYVASHDLQEPLRMITVYAQLLGRELDLPPGDERRESLEQIQNGAKRMRALIADLLEYTKVRLEREEPAAIVDLDAVLQTVLTNLRSSIEESGAAIAAEHLPRVRGKEAHFVSLLQNLVENAIKYRGADPPRIRISSRWEDGEAHFAVSDNGVGIAPEYREQVFQVFKRLHGGSIPGTGVGLAICQRIVERYGGRIWVEPAEEGGARFRFTLPRLLAEGENAHG